jgi:hypothetical protein
MIRRIGVNSDIARAGLNPESGTVQFTTKFIDSLAQRSYCCGVKTANISSGFSWQPGWENDSE